MRECDKSKIHISSNFLLSIIIFKYYLFLNYSIVLFLWTHEFVLWPTCKPLPDRPSYIQAQWLHISTYSLVISYFVLSSKRTHTVVRKSILFFFEVALKNFFSQATEIYCTYVRRYCVFFKFIFCIINLRCATFWKGKEKTARGIRPWRVSWQLAKNHVSLPRLLQRHNGKQISKVYRWIRITPQVKLWLQERERES